DEPYSKYRMAAMGRELALDLSALRFIRRGDLHHYGNIECAIIMDNEILPPNPGLGRKNIYVCQFPFPINNQEVARRWGNLDAVDTIVVYSRFVEDHVRNQLAGATINHDDIRIIHPPVPQHVAGERTDLADKTFRVTLMGRFFAGGHNKRHDVGIEAVRELTQMGVKIELHLIGSLHPGSAHRDHYSRLQQQAADLPVTFHANAAPEMIEHLFGSSDLYWHAAGLNVDPVISPERCEHFGIS